MRYAWIAPDGPQFVDAGDDSLSRRRDYWCPAPLCGGRVFLKRGTLYAPHFAHRDGEGSPKCDEYHPAESTGIPASDE
jgi:competence CoiA-like predicted nuclease